MPGLYSSSRCRNTYICCVTRNISTEGLFPQDSRGLSRPDRALPVRRHRSYRLPVASGKFFFAVPRNATVLIDRQIDPPHSVDGAIFVSRPKHPRLLFWKHDTYLRMSFKVAQVGKVYTQWTWSGAHQFSFDHKGVFIT